MATPTEPERLITLDDIAERLSAARLDLAQIAVYLDDTNAMLRRLGERA